MKFILALGVFLLLFVSCGKDNKQKVGFLLPNFSDARYPKDRDFYIEKMKQYGVEVLAGNAENDEGKQEQQAKDMIRQGVKVLVITPVNQFSAASIVRLAHANGIKVIAYERLVQNSDVDFFIGFDHYEVGKLQAKYALKYKPSGNYLIIAGDKSDHNAELIIEGQLDELKSAGSGVKVIYKSFIEDWSGEGAFMEMKDVLNYNEDKVDVVLCANDGMANGVIEALSKFQPDYPAIVTGLDADLPACKRILAGTQSMTVYKPFKMQAEMAGELSYKILKNENTKDIKAVTNNGTNDVPTVLLTPIAVDKENFNSTIVKDAFYTQEQLNQ